MKVYVKSLDMGFWTQEPITVARYQVDGDEKELVWCNHAGAEEEEVENQIYRIDHPDIVWTDKVLVCKCGAYRFLNDSYWSDAPIDGEHND